MRHTIRLHGVIVGHSELEQIDRESGRAWGRFRPGLGFDLVQPIFRLFAEACPRDGSAQDAAKLESYRGARDALKLELLDAQGTLIPTSTIHIADYREGSSAADIELEVVIPDDRYWRIRCSNG
jgi:hypothetical protein